MQKWNMIIDVAECTNCNLCTLAAMDEYVGNEFPGYSAPMPKHGHRWIDILQKERGQVPMIDIAYVPTMCNHCDNAPCLSKGGDAVKKRDDGIVIIDPEKAKGPQGPRRKLPLRPHLVERGAAAAAGLDVRRPSHRPGLAADARPAVVPDRRHARDQGRGRGDGAHGERARPRSDEAGGRHQAARLLPQPLALLEVLHRRHDLDRGERRGRLRRGRRGKACSGKARWWRKPRATTTATSNSTSSNRTPAPMWSTSPPRAARSRSRHRSGSASISARSGCSAYSQFLRISSRPSLAGR